MAALLQEWLVEDLKIQSPCDQLEKARAVLISILCTVKSCHRQWLHSLPAVLAGPGKRLCFWRSAS